MELNSLSDSAYSLIPPLTAVLLAVLTRRVLLSLGIGIIIGTLQLTAFNVANTLLYIKDALISLVWEDGSLNTYNLSILLFLVLLGMITSLMTVSGATRAFATWAHQRVKSKRGSNLLAVFLGIFIFIDDYFNSLAVGSVSRPVTDKYKVSRAKLAYLLDSTAAPMCVLMPASSWGAYIIALIGGILVSHGITDVSPLMAFVEMVPMNFYAIFAILMVIAVAVFQWDIGWMKGHEKRAESGELYDSAKGTPPGVSAELPESNKGYVKDLIIPILALVSATLFFMVYTGAKATDGEFSLLRAFENTDVATSLVFGSLTGLLITWLMTLRLGLGSGAILQAFKHGLLSMLPAIIILLFAWTIAGVIGNLETGKYLASLVSGNISPALLPAILFILSGIMAFSTGTSWGTFGIMLPIAGDMAAGTQISLMMPMLAAVLAGSVFGDHCSPISDTTILSSTGAGCHHIDHVLTQLPYALSIAVVALVGYLVMGISGSFVTGFASASFAFVLVCVAFSSLTPKY